MRREPDTPAGYPECVSGLESAASLGRVTRMRGPAMTCLTRHTLTYFS
jgi:hypothetical protein